MRSSRTVVHQCVRSTIQSASSSEAARRRRSGASAARASTRSASACSLGRGETEQRDEVGLPCAASLPAVLPSVAAEPSTSSTSSTTWNARPAARGVTHRARSVLAGVERPAARRAEAHRRADQRARLHPVHRLELRQRASRPDAARGRSPGPPPCRARRPRRASSAHAPAGIAQPARRRARRTRAPAARRRREAPSPRRTRRGTSACRGGARRRPCRAGRRGRANRRGSAPPPRPRRRPTSGSASDELAGGIGEQRTHALAAAQHRVAHRLDERAAARSAAGSARSSTSSMRRCRSPHQTAKARSGFIAPAARLRRSNAFSTPFSRISHLLLRVLERRLADTASSSAPRL